MEDPIWFETDRCRWALSSTTADSALSIPFELDSSILMDVVITVTEFCDGEGDWIGVETGVYFEVSSGDELLANEFTTIQVDP